MKNAIISFMFHFFLDINKGSPIDYKGNSGSACSTPTKDTLKQYDRNCMGPVLPPRGTLCGPPGGMGTGSGISSGLGGNISGSGMGVGGLHHHHYSTPLNFRKGISSKCTWKCTAIIAIVLCIVLSILLGLSGNFKILLNLTIFKI